MNSLTGLLRVLLRATRFLLLEVVGRDFSRTSLTILAMFFTSISSDRANAAVMTCVLSFKLHYDFYGTPQILLLLKLTISTQWFCCEGDAIGGSRILCKDLRRCTIFFLEGAGIFVNFLRQKHNVETKTC